MSILYNATISLTIHVYMKITLETGQVCMYFLTLIDIIFPKFS